MCNCAVFALGTSTFCSYSPVGSFLKLAREGSPSPTTLRTNVASCAPRRPNSPRSSSDLRQFRTHDCLSRNSGSRSPPDASTCPPLAQGSQDEF
ncbi:UNVERIFIED_CONTAM: hypothetical protein Sradi_3636400 [Sesamum radiatum]|uniref:Secreted protein n=1 Tax=Sesamum radiatum TaxID=300843 RepID=A0AAW2QJN2_SESRA